MDNFTLLINQLRDERLKNEVTERRLLEEISIRNEQIKALVNENRCLKRGVGSQKIFIAPRFWKKLRRY